MTQLLLSCSCTCMWVKSISVLDHRLISVIFGSSSYSRDHLSFSKTNYIRLCILIERVLPVVVAPPRAHTTSSHCISAINISTFYILFAPRAPLVPALAALT